MTTTLKPMPYGTAIITGASVRIGRAIALTLAENGLKVAIHHRGTDDDAVQAVLAEIQALGGTACDIAADLSDPKSYANMVSDVARKLGSPVDVLVNNAAVFENDTLATLTNDSWEKHMAVNLQAPVMLSQAMAAELPADAHGCIINIIDQRTLKLNPQYFSYTLAKSALKTATHTMAQALAPRIRVNGIAPGPTLANQFQAPEDFAEEAARVPLGVGPAVSEITRAVTFLLETPSLTGQMLALDGGQHLAWRTEDILED